GESDHAVDTLLLGSRACEAHLGLRPRVQERMAVGIDETGNGAALSQLDELEIAARFALALLARAYPGKPAVPDQHRRRAGLFRVQRVKGCGAAQIGDSATAGLCPGYMTHVD